ncbi:hypothetical protein ACFQXB_13645 [Plastorhodobacter daqingensis]|uniref:Uncharacterized protein n=1 Tax=Plastorhodobacter daqingensis TaxID=1387281 RepID=A0ABW2UM04_9RHOB
MKRAPVLFAAIAGLFLPWQARAADPALVARAMEVVQICAAHIPDFRAARAAVEEAGFRSEGTDGVYHWFTERNRVLVGITATQAPYAGCGVTMNRLSVQEARAAVQAFLPSDTALEIPLEGRRRVPDALWGAVIAGKPMWIAIEDRIDTGLTRGAFILVLPVEERG